MPLRLRALARLSGHAACLLLAILLLPAFASGQDEPVRGRRIQRQSPLVRIVIPGSPIPTPPGRMLLTCDLYLASEDRTTPFLVLAHSGNSSRGEYREIGKRLKEMGYNCLAVDLRAGGRTNRVQNMTTRFLGTKGVTTNKLQVQPDIVDALRYAREQYADGPLLCLGSAGNANLAMAIAVEHPDLVDGVCAFSPGNYFEDLGKPADWARQLAARITCPTFVAGNPGEQKAVQGIHDALGTAERALAVPAQRGGHGVRMLWSDAASHQETWRSLEGFLRKHFPVPASAETAVATLRLPPFLSSGMVLPRASEVPIWGRSGPGQTVEVRASFAADAVSTTSDAEGDFSVALATPGAGGPHTIHVTAGGVTRTLDDVLVGEVWLGSGQSNMEWKMRELGGPAFAARVQALKETDLTRIRYFDVADDCAARPRGEVRGAWKVGAPETLADCSAVALFFGHRLAEELDVPVGLVTADWGGTVCEAWMSGSAAEAFRDFEPQLELLALPDAALARTIRTRVFWWDELEALDGGVARGWAQAEPAAMDATWETIELPGLWDGDPGLGDFDGVVWFRRTFLLNATEAAAWNERDLTLALGPIDDMDTTWLNGTRVGGIEWPDEWTQPRRYPIPGGSFVAGTNVIAVRVLDTGGGGGFAGVGEPFGILSADGGELLPLVGKWSYAAGPTMETIAAGMDEPPRKTFLHPNQPTVLYNAMIAPLTRFPFRGVIWYQGESNVSRPIQYRELFPALIADWRGVFGQPELPFLFVQLAPYAYEGDTGQAALLRDAQRKALRVPGTGMAVTMDVGDPADIHPTNKWDVGERLARWALNRVYGRDVVPSGPLFRGFEREGEGLRVRFDHAAGLTSRGGELRNFVVAANDRVFHPAEVRIEGETLFVWSPEVKVPVSVRYGFGAADEATLWNGAGLPAASFCSDDWFE